MSRGCLLQQQGQKVGLLVQAGMRWGKGPWNLGCLVGHGFGGGLLPIHLSKGSRLGAVEDVGCP